MAQKLCIDLRPNWTNDDKQKILQSICALLNEKNGGELVLNSPNGNDFLEEDVSGFLRALEQILTGKIGASSVTECVNFELRQPNQVSFAISALQSPPYFCTLDLEGFGLMLPSVTQVQSTSACNVNDLKFLIDILDEREALMEHSDNLLQPTGTVLEDARFVRGKHLPHPSHHTESKGCQFKLVKSTSTESTSIASRIVSKTNKLNSYVAAFANHRGGFIYYGVNDSGLVEGETLKDEARDREKIIKSVTAQIKKMKWPERLRELERGNHWEIHFVPVDGEDGKPISSTYVIVITVKQCPGGVFTHEPESYTLVNGEVQRMPFVEWKKRILESKPFLLQACALTEQCVLDMDEKACKITEQLVKLRNDGDFDTFDVETKRLLKEANETRLVVLSQLAAVAVRKGKFGEAMDLNEEYAWTLAKLTPTNEVSKDFKAKELYTYSQIMRGKGEIEKSLEIAQEGLKIVDGMPRGLITAWFNAHCASLLTILARRGNADFVEKAESFSKAALEHAENLTAYPIAKADLEQRVRINQAMALLRCCLTGESDDVATIPKEDLKKAQDELECVRISFERFPATNFCKIQYELARSDLCFRSSQVHKDSREMQLAKEHSEIAKKLAQKFAFEELKRYANKRNCRQGES